ncbi:transglycosylase SLT domain-containing protein [Methyloversatilis sp.]|uniref:transglycosylase SLT domain-containing protein n=1 Tax=Methyloversatilis sp. TaxID=2569862 RepID=UPI0035B4BD2B
MNKFFVVLRGAVAVVLHFAHGGLLAVGVMVSVFVALRVAEAGLTPRMLPALPEFSLIGSVQAVSAGVEAVPTDVPATVSGSHLSAQQKMVADHVARRHRVAKVAVEQYVGDVYAAASRYKLDPLLLVALISVESAFNPAAESAWGAQGLTQVIPKYHLEKIAQFGPDATLLDPTTSIFVGAQVLREYVRSAGSVEGGLQRYVGSIEDPDQIYSNKVLAEYRRLGAMFAPRQQVAEAAL